MSEAPSGMWACSACTLYNPLSEKQCTACGQPKRHLTREEEEEKLEEATEVLSGIFTTKKPSHAGSGIAQGFGNVFRGVASGAGAMVAMPVMGAKEGGVGGFVAGLGAGVVTGVGLTVAGAATGVAQAGRGVANSPSAMAAAAEGKEWDQESGKWILYSLPEEARTVLNMTDQEYLESLKRSGPDTARSTERSSNTTEQQQQQQQLPERKVKDKELYDLLGVSPNVPPEKIKRAYYLQARKCHPDKNPDDPEAHEKFQKLGEAYQILSDPEMRSKYDQHGKEGVNNNQMLDPSAMFTMLFGSEKFTEFVGQLQIATFVALQEEHGDNSRTFQKLQTFRQKQREVRCAVSLCERLDLFVAGQSRDLSQKEENQNTKEFEKKLREEARDLSQAPFGGPMLQTVGYIYDEQSAKFLGNPFDSAVAGMRANARAMNNRYNALKSGIRVYEEVAKMQKDGQNIGEEARMSSVQSMRLMEAMLDAIWQSNVLDIDHTLRNVAHKVLFDRSVDKPTRKQRAKGLAIIGKVFREIGGSGPTDTRTEIRKQLNPGGPPPGEIGVGAHVSLLGLNSHAFNGQVGVVIGDSVDGRFPVMLESGKNISVKRENMVVL